MRISSALLCDGPTTPMMHYDGEPSVRRNLSVLVDCMHAGAMYIHSATCLCLCTHLSSSGQSLYFLFSCSR